MTEHERQSEAVAEPASAGTDSLTGLGLRGALELDGPGLLLDAAQHGRAAALLLVDLDGFKHLNDSAGHHVGDQVLTEAARRLEKAIRPGDLIVRLGGDEFAVLTRPLESLEEASLVAEQVLAVFDDLFAVEELALAVGASVGVATFPEDGETISALSLAADQAMYDAKESGNRSWRAWHQRGAYPTGWSARLLADLRSPRSRDQMVVHYQPQLEIRTGEIAGFDALVRWDHPEHGLLAARQFVPLAARSALLRPITAAVIQHSLDALPQLQAHAPGSRVSISMTRRHILGQDLVEQLVDALDERRLHPEHLMLKINEPLTRAQSAPQPIFEDLAERGIGVTIRGYGKAWSSLTALWRNPAVREVKIDPALGRDVLVDPRSMRLVRALAAGAHELGLRVAAESVEREDAVAVLSELGCDVVQGFWLCPPMTLSDTVEWCRDRSASTTGTSV